MHEKPVVVFAIFKRPFRRSLCGSLPQASWILDSLKEVRMKASFIYLLRAMRGTVCGMQCYNNYYIASSFLLQPHSSRHPSIFSLVITQTWRDIKAVYEQTNNCTNGSWVVVIIIITLSHSFFPQPLQYSWKGGEPSSSWTKMRRRRKYSIKRGEERKKRG